jgi:hypothetical protein
MGMCALLLSAKVMGATYLLLHSDGSQAVPGLWRNINPDAGLALTSELTQGAYLGYDVEAATDFADTDGIAKRPDNAAFGYPFAI